ncbi:hypothetical protein EOA19_34245 [Mesorhizobium sp. M7A.F.Ca.US.010.02.1.1]|nr:hypothetical protein EOA19_34245 [Mesorhizobium sp. M7A.F.Ca.US.010.02.1.1]
MLDERIGSGRLAATEINEVGKMLADFYAHYPAEIDGGAYLRHLIGEQRINRAILLRPEFAFSDIASGPLDMVDGLLQRLRPRIEARILRGAIVEGHGDLRPEHVCLCRPPQIIDCLEFNRSMRTVDPLTRLTISAWNARCWGAMDPTASGPGS